nr:zinc finger BED domain-containing protein RICESLEEPER 2 [Tanacetum cinerariifolium]
MIWKDFNLCLMSDNTKKDQCIHCLYFFSKDFNSTLKNHIPHHHCEALKRAVKPRKSSMSRDGSLFVYISDVLRVHFAGLVIQRGLPFNHFDEEQTTRVFQKHLQPRYNHLSSTTLKCDAMKLWKNKSMSITLDNASNNTSAIGKLKLKYDPPMEGSGAGGSSSRAGHGNQVTSLLRRLKEHKNKKARSGPSLSFEYERYVHSDFVTHLQTTEFETFDVLGFWKAKETTFPVLSHMTMDILNVQATSVASEFEFSTSGRVLSIRRTRLTPASLEMYMCLKEHLDAQERKQDKSTLETQTLKKRSWMPK